MRKIYEFIAKMPLVSFRLEKVYFDIPFMDQGSIYRALIEFERVLDQRKKEVDRAKEKWS